LPPAGIGLTVASSDSTVSVTPTTIAVPANGASGTFNLTTSQVRAITSVSIVATLTITLADNSKVVETMTARLTLQGSLASIVLGASTVTAGQSMQATVNVSGQMLTDTSIGVVSNDPSIAVVSPVSVTIPAGQLSASLQITGMKAGSTTFTATQGPLKQTSAALTVQPAKDTAKDTADSLKEQRDKNIRDTKDDRDKVTKDNKEVKDGKGALREKVQTLADSTVGIPGRLQNVSAVDARLTTATPLGGRVVDPVAMILLLTQRLDELEERMASARSFIRPEERPDVARTTLDRSDSDGRGA
jgi:hypothetical protein